MVTLIRTILICSLIASIPALASERIKDIASIAGVRSNQLIGYGLVVGLDGTGDKSGQQFTEQTFANMLNRLGIMIPPGTKMDSKNIAAVIVTAELPPFVKHGHTIDVTVASIGSAKSLRGGSLLMTPLKGIDGEVYAIAQGNLFVGGFNEGGAGANIQKNVPSVGRIPGGAAVEKLVPNPFYDGEHVVFNLHRPDFTTSKRIAEAITKVMGPGIAEPMDAASVKIKAPMEPAKRVNYVSVIENIQINSAKAPAKIIINARNGTIVIGQSVLVEAAAVSHGNLTVTIEETPQVSQPEALSGGETTVTPETTVEVTEDEQSTFVIGPSTSLDDIVKAMNAVGATPGDMTSILQALKQVGALKAELIII